MTEAINSIEKSIKDLHPDNSTFKELEKYKQTQNENKTQINAQKITT